MSTAIARCDSESYHEESTTWLTVRERMLLHLLMQHGRIGDFDAPEELTALGCAAALGISRAHATLTLNEMIAAGEVGRGRRHVPGRATRLFCYENTEFGHMIAVGLREMLETRGACIEELIMQYPPHERTTIESLRNDAYQLKERMARDQLALQRLIDQLEGAVC
jgi:predicted transcriptional regulator